MKVSEQTESLVRAYDMVGDIYNKAYQAMCSIYNEDDALKVIEKEFEPERKAFEAAILRLVAISVKEKHGLTTDEI